MAHPGRLTDERAEKIAHAILTGNTVASSAAAANVSTSSLMGWLDRGRRERSRLDLLDHDDDDDPELAARERPYLEFLERIEQARAQAEVTAVAIIRQAMLGWDETTVLSEERITPDGTTTTRRTVTVRKFDWKAAAWWLERTFPQVYGRQAIEAAANGALAVESIEELRERARKLVEDELAAKRQQRALPPASNGQAAADG